MVPLGSSVVEPHLCVQICQSYAGYGGRGFAEGARRCHGDSACHPFPSPPRSPHDTITMTHHGHSGDLMVLFLVMVIGYKVEYSLEFPPKV